MGHVSFRELLPVRVVVAVLALRWCRFEIDIDQLRFQIWRFMAVDAGGRPMSARQWELRLGMIEA